MHFLLNTLKSDGLVDLKTALTMYKAHPNLLPHCIQELFETIESNYKLREMRMFKKTGGGTNI